MTSRLHAAVVALLACGACAPAAATCAGCDNGNDRREAQRLVDAVAYYRRADNDGKPAAAAGLHQVTCTAPDVCHARDLCVASADATAKALVLKAEIERGLLALEKGGLPKESAEAQALPKKVDEAEALLNEGRKNLEPCDDALMALKRKHAF